MDIIVNDFYGLDMATTKEYGFGGDALLLAEFAKPKFKDTVLDLCTGCGVVPVMMMANGFKGRVTAVDIQPGAIELCKWTAEKNGVQDRFFPVLADLNELKWEAESFSLITVNPPYFVSGAGKENEKTSRDLARRESGCTLAQVTKVAGRLLKYGGRFCMCHRPERLCDIIVSMRQGGIEVKRVRFVVEKKGKQPWLVLVEGKRGSKSGVTIEGELVMKNDDGSNTDEFRAMFGDYMDGHQ